MGYILPQAGTPSTCHTCVHQQARFHQTLTHVRQISTCLLCPQLRFSCSEPNICYIKDAKIVAIFIYSIFTLFIYIFTVHLFVCCVVFGVILLFVVVLQKIITVLKQVSTVIIFIVAMRLCSSSSPPSSLHVFLFVSGSFCLSLSTQPAKADGSAH